MTNHKQKLRTAVAARRRVDLRLHRVAYEAHQAGVSWLDIAAITGLTRQTVSARYSTPPPASPDPRSPLT